MKIKPTNSPWLANFSPSYFALVMATGIVSIALNNQGWRTPALALFGLNIIFYCVIWTLTLARISFYRTTFFGDLLNHSRAPGFFTTEASTLVLGSQFAILLSYNSIATALCIFGIGLWILINYSFFSSVSFRNPKPSLDQGINGAWLLAVVSTQAVSILCSLVATTSDFKEHFFLLSLGAFLLGILLYLVIITLILFRWMFFPMSAEQMTPDYWINMGAIAITTLAGANLLLATNHWHLLQILHPFLTGITLAAWSIATWWIPFLCLAGFWKHIVLKASFQYSPTYWAMVFPLGMYPAATFATAKALDLHLLFPVSTAFSLIALTVWCIVFAGLLCKIFSCVGKNQ